MVARLGRKLSKDETLLLMDLGANDGKEFYADRAGVRLDEGVEMPDLPTYGREECYRNIRSGESEAFLLIWEDQPNVEAHTR